MKKPLLPMFALPLVLTLAGCNLLEYPFYVLFGQTTKTVPAAYKGLENRRVAVVIIGQPGIDFEHPFARTDLAIATQAQIREQLPSVTFVEPETVEDFMRSEVEFLAMPISDIAAGLQAERILYIELLQFTMREPDSINLLRGHIWAQVSIFEAEAVKPNLPAYETDIEVIHPEQAPMPASDEASYTVWQTTIGTFADQLAKKFYKHKESTR